MSELGVTDIVSHTIDTGSNPPIRQPVRHTPFALREKMEELIQNMMAQGVIKQSSSPWANPVVLVEKRDGSHRFCVDYRRLNAVIKMDVFLCHEWMIHWICSQGRLHRVGQVGHGPTNFFSSYK